MAFITGLILIDAPAAALNNSDEAGQNNEVQVKQIRTRSGIYPYVSAQAYRYWLRTTLDNQFVGDWSASPVYSGAKGKKQQAFTEGNPIRYPDDDLMGYMRAEKDETLTRISPFRTSTLVALAPSQVTSDFGVMARIPKEEGDKEGVVRHQHQFYRTVLKGLFSLNLNAAGTFSNQMKSGYQNLSKAADLSGLVETRLQRSNDVLTVYRLPIQERIRRVQVLLRAMGRIEGGAKQTLHYTDVTPVFVMAGVTKGGNHMFSHAVIADSQGLPILNEAALVQMRDVFEADILDGSQIYVGRTAGFMDDAQPILEGFQLTTLHPRQALDTLADDLAQHPEWMD